MYVADEMTFHYKQTALTGSSTKFHRRNAVSDIVGSDKKKRGQKTNTQISQAVDNIL